MYVYLRTLLPPCPIGIGRAHCCSYAVEFATITLDPTTKQPRSKIYKPVEVDALLEKHGVDKSAEDRKKDVEMKP
jgi:hypothetical protein